MEDGPASSCGAVTRERCPRVSRQSVHTRLQCYRQEGIAGLEDRSQQVRGHPTLRPMTKVPGPQR